MITEDEITEIFCVADGFCKFFDAMTAKYTLKPIGKRKYHRNSTMSKAEVMLIMILFHTSGYRCFKHFYLEKVHKVFKGIAQRGKSSMGCFFAFKLHLIYNEKGELLNFMITPGDIDDRKPLEYKAFVEFIHGKLLVDKGYISKNLFQRHFVGGIQLINLNSG
ncbi:hypothetical protein HMPREF9332_00065 [Alloprevotella rava F0323]|uniref:Transposase DDE domain-containing protein n=1 Tax=Alloprevotella rava F0323 TaxID=679199 RepID=G5G915_9BACT|nr:transposase [Alloprevotella rava]EHG24913.1 hypothetical protein HMPREF9332_00065 [Alloprevotella rava F0323]